MDRYVFLTAFTLVVCLYLGAVAPDYHCDVICDDDETTGQQVCGDDGVTYASSCHFDNAVCLARNQSQFLRKAYSGPCINMSTPCNVVLQQRCHHTYSRSLYVCGTDGRTYTSECVLATAYCKTLQDPDAQLIELDHRGACNRLTNESRLVDCSQWVENSTQLAIENHAPVPLQLKRCPSSHYYHPLCALDGHTQVNECWFCHDQVYNNLMTRANLTAYIAHDGRCHHVSSIVG